MRTTEERTDQSKRSGRAVAEVKESLVRLHRGFVWWGSLYEDADLPYEQERRRGEIVVLLSEFSGNYLARSVWLENGTRKKIERFIAKSEHLYSDFVADIVDRGYAHTRDARANRAGKQLGPLRREAEASLEGELAGGSRQRGWGLRPGEPFR